MKTSIASLVDSLPLHKQVGLIQTHSSGLVAIEKPPGIRAHPNTDEPDKRALLNVPYDRERECYTWQTGAGKTGSLYLLNRLDAPTSGIMLGAVNEAMAHLIRDLFARHEVTKCYYAIVKGNVRRVTRQWRDRLVVTCKDDQLRCVSDNSKGEPASTNASIKKVSRGDVDCTMLKLEPNTGRTHQLRVQCAKRHMPIIGDGTYGDFNLNHAVAKATGFKRMFLHASDILIKYRYQGKNLSFSAHSPLPDEFMELLKFEKPV